MTDNDRILQRIDAARDDLKGEDRRVIDYIESQIRPEGLEDRRQDEYASSDVKHLREVAHAVLRRYDNESYDYNAKESA